MDPFLLLLLWTVAPEWTEEGQEGHHACPGLRSPYPGFDSGLLGRDSKNKCLFSLPENGLQIKFWNQETILITMAVV
jgi:hypothetical protein